MTRDIIKFEFIKHITVRSAFVTGIFIALCFYVTSCGIAKYKSDTQKTVALKTIEQQKIKIFFLPSPCVTLCFNAGVFPENPPMLDFSMLMYYLGIAAFFYGMFAFDKKDYLELLCVSSGPRRLVAMIMAAKIIFVTFSFFVLIIFLSVFFLLNDLNPLKILSFEYLLTSLVFLLFFLSTGFALGLLKNRKHKHIAAGLIIITFVLFPSVYNTILARQVDENIDEHAKAYQEISIFFPLQFYHTVAQEVSGQGYNGYIDFERHIKTLSQLSPDPEKTDHFFPGKSTLPRRFALGLGISLFYTLFLLTGTFIVYKRRFTKNCENRQVIDIKDVKNTNPAFILCGDEQLKQDIINRFSNKNTVTLKKINPGDFRFPGLASQKLLRHLGIITGSDTGKIIEFLHILGVDNLKNLRELPDETIKKMITAVTCAGPFSTYIFDDFLLYETRELEEKIFLLVQELVEQKKQVIFLGLKMYDAIDSLSEFKIDSFAVFSLPLHQVTLR